MEKNILVLYESEAGLTRQYAEWIAEELDCQAIPLKDSDLSLLNSADLVVFGGGLRAGRINGLTRFWKLAQARQTLPVIIFTTGASPAKLEYVEKTRQANFGQNDPKPLNFFYFESGMIFERHGLIGKIMKVVFSLMARKNASEPFSGSFDHSKREWIQPLVDFVKSHES